MLAQEDPVKWVIKVGEIDASSAWAASTGYSRRAPATKTVSVSSSSRWLLSSTIFAVLVGCSTDPPAPGISRTPAPQEYEKTITNFFAFKTREPQKNTTISFGPPEPGSCSLDGYVNSMRGWVVPVVHETLKGEPGGREAIQITARPYYFWFLGNTIAAVTRRGDRCPGLGSAFDDSASTGALAGRFVLAAHASPSPADALQRDRVDPSGPSAADRAQHRTKAAHGKAQRAKKKVGPSAGIGHSIKVVRSHVRARIESNPSET